MPLIDEGKKAPLCELPSSEVVTWAQDVDGLGRVRLAGQILGGSSACQMAEA
jgi:hypothetical protein